MSYRLRSLIIDKIMIDYENRDTQHSQYLKTYPGMPIYLASQYTNI